MPGELITIRLPTLSGFVNQSLPIPFEMWHNQSKLSFSTAEEPCHFKETFGKLETNKSVGEQKEVLNMEGTIIQLNKQKDHLKSKMEFVVVLQPASLCGGSKLFIS